MEKPNLEAGEVFKVYVCIAAWGDPDDGEYRTSVSPIPCKARHTDNRCGGCQGERVLKVGVIEDSLIQFAGPAKIQDPKIPDCESCQYHGFSANNKCTAGRIHYSGVECSDYLEKAIESIF